LVLVLRAQLLLKTTSAAELLLAGPFLLQEQTQRIVFGEKWCPKKKNLA
jgi:hypothetical protein